MNFTEEALRFLSINSISKGGNEEIVNFLIPAYEAMGAKEVMQHVSHSLEDHSRRQFNLIGILGDDLVDTTTPKGLLLLTHVDTPGPGNLSDWQRLNAKPWVPQVEDGDFVGLGAVMGRWLWQERF